jgi:hypothetical protein
MAAVARRNLADYAGWRVDISDFEAWQPSPGDQPFGLVTSAQAWHWLDPAVRFRKAHHLLGPGGWLARWWNRPDDDDSPLSQAIEAVYSKLVPSLPARGIGSKAATSDEIPPSVAFGPPLQRAYRWSRTYSATEWTALIETQSDHRLLPPQVRASVLAELRTVINAYGGSYRHRYVCWLRAVQRQ